MGDRCSFFHMALVELGLIKMALVLDFAFGYLFAGRVIWQGHFFYFVVPQPSPS